MLNKECTLCGKTYEGIDIYELRRYFSPNRKTRDGLETRCKECKNEMAKKYRVSRAGDKELKEKYKGAYDTRKKIAKYSYGTPSHLQTNEIVDGVKYLEARLIELKQELAERTMEVG